jgi:hypothetical protein
MNRFSGIGLLVLLCAPLAAPAQYDYERRTPTRSAGDPQLSYTLGEVRLLAEDPDGREDADGIRIGGSALVHESFFVTGALSTTGSDGPNGLDTDVFELGLGFRHAFEEFTRDVDLIGIAGLVRVDRDFGTRRDDDDFGPSLTGGARASLAPAFEVGGFVNYTEVFGDGDLTLLTEGLYHATPNISLLAGLGLSDDTRQVNIGARWNFSPTR